MKKFLSMVMALVMVMSLVTISAGAKDFTDNDKITYDEAVAVVSTIGVVDGDTNGAFRPTDTLTRQAAAKIICNLILGPTTAAELHADTAPYKDVPVNNQFAGYIAYCQSRGIISGYADGTFRPTGTLTGYAFMKMLLGALGYDSTLEGYVGANWSINVAKQALGIGLNKGLQGDFNGIKAVTREEACLYAFRTLQSDLVEYGQRLTTSINGTEVTLSSGGAKSRAWNSQQSRYDYIREDNLIQFAEEYFNKLEKKKDTDDFERPGYTWIYDKEEIGTYVDWDLLVEEYHDSVTGRDLYDLLGASTIKENELIYFVDGVKPSATHPEAGYTRHPVTAGEDIEKADLARNNQDDVGATGRGVLTQVFLDKEYTKDEGRITIVSINTWLAQAAADYNEKREELELTVYVDMHGSGSGKKTDSASLIVALEEVPAIADMEEDDFALVNISYRDNPKGEVVIMQEPEILEEAVVTKYSDSSKNVASKLTTGGTEYKNNLRAFYSDDTLSTYATELLTDTSYNVYLDQYGNFIGVKLFEGTKRYVFITGFDRPTSNLSISTATAAAIFLDGTMQSITVNVSKTNANIAAFNKAPSDANSYYVDWSSKTLPGTDGSYRYNRWFAYNVNADGVYTLKPVNMTATDYEEGKEPILRTSSVYVDDNIYDENVDQYDSRFKTQGTVDNVDEINNSKYSSTKDERVYANDDTVFITVGTDKVDTSLTTSMDVKNEIKRAITEVTGVYTGIQDVEIELDKTKSTLQEAMIYTVYDSDHYIIGAITVGEAKGTNATIAFVTSKAKSERIEGQTYYWEFKAILNGEEQTLTVKGDYDLFTTGTAVIDEECNEKSKSADGKVNSTDGLVELRFDADDYVVAIRPVAESNIYSYYGSGGLAVTPKWKGGNSIGDSLGSTDPGDRNTTGKNEEPIDAATGRLDLRDAKAYRMNVIRTADGNCWQDADGSYHYYDSAPNELTLVGRTLYVTKGQKDEGLSLASDCKAVVIQDQNKKTDVMTHYSSVNSALRNVALNPTTGEFEGEIVAVMNDRGAAAWVLIKSHNALQTNAGKPTTGGAKITSLTAVSHDGTNLSFTINNVSKGQDYTLEIYRLFNSGWTLVDEVTVTATNDDAPETFAPAVPLISGEQYRLVCGTKYANFTA